MNGARLFGIETEYAVTALDPSGAVLPRGCLSEALLRTAAKTLPSVRGTSDVGLFLANGSRLYCDAGDHPELAGPECCNPWDTVRYARAGDGILLRLAHEAQRSEPALADARVFTGNVDYGGSRCTWGTHESYCHRGDPRAIRRRLVPHLVSRVIYSGAGGFNPFSCGLEFTLSPRAHHLHHVISDQSTHNRGIIHTRDEPLAGRGYRRQHLICGESLRSDVATWLTIGTTALVVAMIEGGIGCGDDVELAAPVAALRTFAGDAECRVGVPARNGAVLTAIEIQRRYLDSAATHLNEPFMPPWSKVVCERWEEMLDRLVDGPRRVSQALDWAIKLAIYRERARRCGFPWQSLAEWSVVVDALEKARTAGAGPRRPLSAALLDEDPALRRCAAALTPLDDLGVRPENLEAFLALRHELLEVDMRWGQLGAEGVFEALDRAGVLDHRVAGVDRIDQAIDQPPIEGRASIRGTVIRRLSSERDRFSAGWTFVFDHQTNRRLDLSDPFTGIERWCTQRTARENAGNPTAEPELVEDASFWNALTRALGRVPTTSVRNRSSRAQRG